MLITVKTCRTDIFIFRRCLHISKSICNFCCQSLLWGLGMAKFTVFFRFDSVPFLPKAQRLCTRTTHISPQWLRIFLEMCHWLITPRDQAITLQTRVPLIRIRRHWSGHREMNIVRGIIRQCCANPWWYHRSSLDWWRYRPSFKSMKCRTILHVQGRRQTNKQLHKK